jgi:hypothetical protein
VSQNMQNLSFWSCLIAFNIISSSFIHVAANDKCHWFFELNNIPPYIYIYTHIYIKFLHINWLFLQLSIKTDIAI